MNEDFIVPITKSPFFSFTGLRSYFLMLRLWTQPPNWSFSSWGGCPCSSFPLCLGQHFGHCSPSGWRFICRTESKFLSFAFKAPGSLPQSTNLILMNSFYKPFTFSEFVSQDYAKILLFPCLCALHFQPPRLQQPQYLSPSLGLPNHTSRPSSVPSPM